MLTRVTENIDLGEGWVRLEAECPELAVTIESGQFVQVRIGNGDDPLVRRPFSVYDLNPDPGPNARYIRLLYQVVGPGTRWMRGLRRGDSIDMLGPLGRPMPRLELPSDGILILVGGGIGVAPLYLHCRELLATAPPSRAHVLLGARCASLLVGLEAFQELGIPTSFATDDGSAGLRGTVVDLLRARLEEWGERPVGGIGCGPHGMNMALRDFAVDRDLDFWISLENYMPCGFGACFGCVIASPVGSPGRYRRVCVEGPCFPARELPPRF